MVGAYVFWSFKTGYFGFQLSTAPAFVLTLVCMAVLGVLIELAIFRPLRNTAPLAKLAASLGLLLVLAGGRDRGLRQHLEVGAVDPALRHGDDLRQGRADRPVHPRRHRDRRGCGAGGAVPLDALRALDEGGVGERGLGDARRPVAEPAGGREHRARERRRGRARGAGRAADHARLADAGVPDRARPRRRAARRLHLLLHRVLRRSRDRRRRSRCSSTGSTQSWFPTDSGGAPLRGLSELFVFLVIVLALFLRGASLPGSRRARREAAARRAPAGAAAAAGGDRGRSSASSR